MDSNTPSTQDQSQYKIPQIVKDQFAELMNLILATESMSVEERNYWFQILPIMTSEQVERLKKILIEEKEQLIKLDDEYQDDLAKLNTKHLQEWDDFERKQARDKLEQAETQAREEESGTEEDLLNQLNKL